MMGRPLVEQLTDAVKYQVGAVRDSISTADWGITPLHESHGEVVKTDSGLIPNLMLWNGRTHLVMMEFKVDRNPGLL